MSTQVDTLQLLVGSPSFARQLGFLANGFVVDNLTNQWVFLSEPFVFIPPYTVAQAGPIQGTQKISARFLAPTGFTQPTTIAGQTAYVRVTADPQPSSPGVAIAPGTVRWSVALFPATGALATATRAAAPGVIHIADMIVCSCFNNNAASTAFVRTWRLIDGPSGGPNVLLSSAIGGSPAATIGVGGNMTAGPGLGIKGTTGIAMTIEFDAVQALAVETVNLIGYDA
jgi:hypothetical protein